jgi:hypothetical protein
MAKENAFVVRFIHTGDTRRFRPRHTAKAVFFAGSGARGARVMKADGSPSVPEIEGMEPIEPGKVCP